MRTFVDVCVIVPGYHCWPSAPDRLAFLRNKHHHAFEIRVRKAVSHDDRDVEFFDLATAVEHHFAQYPQDDLGHYDFGTVSCETLAKRLMAALDLHACGVYEDNGHGAWVEQEHVA